jgi:gamma-tubulin complex component 2
MTCIEDPYEESSFISKGILEVDYADEYGERRCTLRDGSTLSLKRHTSVFLPRNAGGRSPGRACMPLLLESWKYKILLAGFNENFPVHGR